MKKLKHKNPFTAVPNRVLSCSKISFKAKGIYAYLFSKPDGWVFYNNAIMKETSEGLNSFRSGIKELVESGWLIKKQIILENGRFGGTEFELSIEGPMCDFVDTVTQEKQEKSEDLPHTEKPHTEKPHTENHTPYKEILNKKIYNIKNNTLKSITKKTPTPDYFNFSTMVGFEEIDQIRITEDQYSRLTSTHGIQAVHAVLLDFDAYLTNNPRKYKNHYKALGAWLRRDNNKKTPNASNGPKKYMSNTEHNRAVLAELNGEYAAPVGVFG